jgi:hypothetical protein
VQRYRTLFRRNVSNFANFRVTFNYLLRCPLCCPPLSPNVLLCACFLQIVRWFFFKKILIKHCLETIYSYFLIRHFVHFFSFLKKDIQNVYLFYATKQFGGVATALPSKNLTCDFHSIQLKRIHLPDRLHIYIHKLHYIVFCLCVLSRLTNLCQKASCSKLLSK